MKRERVAVAWSGGRDSTALLYATVLSSQAMGLDVVALHVHHGLSAHADDWLAHCQRQCAVWQAHGLPIHFQFVRLVSRPSTGQSIEAWARRERYAALRRMALERGADVVLLAHHRRDQAETLLLQALRGAGVAGLAGMPERSARDGVTWLRPWLRTPRTDIEAYAREHQLSWIDDDSNDDPRFARNRLRLQAWPALSAAFPDAEGSLADAASWAQEAVACLDELARADLQSAADGKRLRVEALEALSPARRSNALRHWLRQQLGRPAEASLVSRLLHELKLPGPHRWPTHDGELRQYRGQLMFMAAEVPALSVGAPEAQLSVTRAGRYRLPGWQADLFVKRVREGGVPLAWLAHLSLVPRRGGERFQAGLGRPPRSLKKQFQAAGVPSWAREAPLLFSGGQLLFVPGLGLDARAIGLPGQAQVSLAWLPSGGGA
jgi:tRNA(Ile)-lysidine synthase